MAPIWSSSLIFFASLLILTSAAENEFDLEAAPSIASDYKVQAVEPNAKYGYPYRIAPTLGPAIQARSDAEEDEEEKRLASKQYGSRISANEDKDVPVKKSHLKKSKIPQASRRQDGEDTSVEKRFRSYVQPKYRNYDELEESFQPRRMDIDIPYGHYSYHKPSRKPPVSPIDPYLTPSAEPGDSFYPVPKRKTYPSSSYGPSSGPSYGAGRYEEPLNYHSRPYTGPALSYPSSGGPSSSYSPNGGPSSYSSDGPSSYSSDGPSSYSSGGPSSYSSGGPSSYSSGGPPSSYSEGGQYGYHDSYSIKSNEPIMGNIRKRLLDYAGASDHYDGEPDYLRQVTRNKYKYGNLGNDYYSYGPVHRDSYRDFPYVETKISLIKKSRGL